MVKFKPKMLYNMQHLNISISFEEVHHNPFNRCKAKKTPLSIQLQLTKIKSNLL